MCPLAVLKTQGPGLEGVWTCVILRWARWRTWLLTVGGVQTGYLAGRRGPCGACVSPAISARLNGTWLDNDRGAEAQGHRKPSGFPSVLMSLEPQPQWPQGWRVWRKPRGGILSLGSRLAFPGKEPGLHLRDDHPVGRASACPIPGRQRHRDVGEG